MPKQCIVALDLEGVLTPEIWVAVAERTGIPELRRTTRDEPDYDRLMRYRLEILNRHGITLPRIQEVIGGLRLLPGAAEFLGTLRAEFQVVILSDTFEQFAAPLLHQLDWPTLLCHRLVVEGERITGYQLRMPDQKRHAVKAFQSLQYRVIAAGDSFNDLTMLEQADRAILFRAPDALAERHPTYPRVAAHAELLGLIRKFAAEG